MITISASMMPFVQITVALLLGGLLGLERTFAHKTAGLRTYSLVSMGSCLLIIISNLVIAPLSNVSGIDPLRLAAGIVTGIGFLGAGLIIFKDSKISGLTTAAGLWVACAIGIAVGFELFSIAVFATSLTLFTFSVLWIFENKIKKIVDRNDLDNGDNRSSL
ncbi:MAG: MgtC/SapB family protein [Parcubacteria group bacterium]|nr:MgtC/SapB family protein [Parcubacteria group bacterium]